jgi:hypothetical protein
LAARSGHSVSITSRISSLIVRRTISTAEFTNLARCAPAPHPNLTYRGKLSFDIFRIDGALTSSQVLGGDHWGPSGSGSNVFEGAVVRTGRWIECWLRTIHSQELDTFGVAVERALSAAGGGRSKLYPTTTNAQGCYPGRPRARQPGPVPRSAKDGRLASGGSEKVLRVACRIPLQRPLQHFSTVATDSSSVGPSDVFRTSTSRLSASGAHDTLYRERLRILVVASRMNARKNLEGTCPETVSVNSMFSGAPEPRDFEAFPPSR